MEDKTPEFRPGLSSHGRRLALYFTANVLFAAGLFSHAFLYNFYLGELGHGESVMGAAAASLTAGGITALAPAGSLVDRFGARSVYLAACVVTFAGLVLGAVAVTWQAIAVAAFIAGAGTATWRVSMGPLLMRLAGPSARSRAFSWNVALLLAFGSLWTGVSGLLPGWMQKTSGLSGLDSVRVVLVAGALATLMGGIPLLRSIGEREAADRSRNGPESSLLERLRRSLSVPRSVAFFVAAVALWMLAGGLVIPFFNVFFLREHGLAVGRIGVLFGVAQAMTALAVFGGGWLAGRTGPRRMLLWWSVLFAPVLWSLAAVSAVPLAVALFITQSFVPAATNPLIDQLLLETTPVERHGAVSTWRNAATELSGLSGAAAGGVLLEATSFGTLFGIAGCVAVLGLLALAWALGRLPATAAATPVPAFS